LLRAGRSGLFIQEKQVKRKTDFIMHNIGDEWLLVPLGAQVMDMNGIITLNDTGVCVWNLLAEERTADELAAAVAEQFEVDSATARGDVQAFLDEIARLGMVE
jgi:sensor domain CHASE-containing protein